MTGMLVLGHSDMVPVPWSLIAPHERQAQKNHDQTLERLAERGGLDPSEMVAVIEDRPWHQMDEVNAINRLAEFLEKMP